MKAGQKTGKPEVVPAYRGLRRNDGYAAAMPKMPDGRAGENVSRKLRGFAALTDLFGVFPSRSYSPRSFKFSFLRLLEDIQQISLGIAELVLAVTATCE